jgi:hypothetical protein
LSLALVPGAALDPRSLTLAAVADLRTFLATLDARLAAILAAAFGRRHALGTAAALRPLRSHVASAAAATPFHSLGLGLAAAAALGLCGLLAAATAALLALLGRSRGGDCQRRNAGSKEQPDHRLSP